MLHRSSAKGVTRYVHLFALLSLFAGMPVLSGCGSPQIFKPSIDEQRRLGREAMTEVNRRYRMAPAADQQRLQRVGQRLVAVLPENQRRTWEFHFGVIQDPQLNAFALPGGPIYMFSGLQNQLNDDALAAVTAHEIVHVTHEHWAQQVAAQRGRQAGAAAVIILAGGADWWGDIANVVDSVVGLQYSRRDEDEADRVGLDMMVRAGYRPEGMIELFNVLIAAQQRQPGVPEFLRSHPLTQDRVTRTQERIAQMRREGRIQ